MSKPKESTGQDPFRMLGKSVVLIAPVWFGAKYLWDSGWEGYPWLLILGVPWCLILWVADLFDDFPGSQD